MPEEISPAGRNPAPSSTPELRASHDDRDRTVERLRVAAGDGRLTSEELDERIEAALSARTLSELAGLTADLPPESVFGGVAVRAGVPVEPATDVVRIDQKFSPVRRVGPWVVPRRMELLVEWSSVTLDFTQAVITHDILQIHMDMQGGALTLIVPPGVVVDPYGLSLEFSKVRNRQSGGGAGAPVRLRVELSGKKSFGRIVIRDSRGHVRRADGWRRA